MRCAQPFKRTPRNWLRQAAGVAPGMSHRFLETDARGVGVAERSPRSLGVKLEHCVGGLALQHGQQVGDGFAQFAAVANEVNRALGLQEFRALEAFR